jgi:hypothetical protein
MKGKIILVITLVACIFKTQAQSKITEGILKTGSASYMVKSMSTTMFIVKNSNDTSSNKKFTNLSSYSFKDSRSVYNTFLKVFSNTRLKQLTPERYLAVNYFYDHTGKITSIKYYIHKNTLINANEIDLLDKALKDNVRFVVPAGETRDNIAPYTQNIFFQELITKSGTNN